MANMAGVKLDNAQYFSIYKEPLTDLIQTKRRVAKNDEATIFQGQPINPDIAFSKVADQSDPKNSSNSFQILANSFQTNIRASMYQAKNLEKALPEVLRQFLDSSRPTAADFHNTYMGRRPPEEIDPDANCLPRRN